MSQLVQICRSLCLWSSCCLEIRTVLLQLAVVHVDCEKLVLISWAKFVPGLWIILAIPADIRVSQAQTGEVQQRHGCSSTDEEKKGDQSWVVSKLFADYGEHFVVPRVQS